MRNSTTKRLCGVFACFCAALFAVTLASRSATVTANLQSLIGVNTSPLATFTPWPWDQQYSAPPYTGLVAPFTSKPIGSVLTQSNVYAGCYRLTFAGIPGKIDLLVPPDSGTYDISQLSTNLAVVIWAGLIHNLVVPGANVSFVTNHPNSPLEQLVISSTGGGGGGSVNPFSQFFITNSLGQFDLSATTSNLLYIVSVAPKTNIIQNAHTVTSDSLKWAPAPLGVGGDGTNHLLFLTVSNIAQLQSLSATNCGTNSIDVQGYYTPNDGGGGTFIPAPGDSTSLTNIGTIFASHDGFRFYRKLSTYVVPEWFGAISDEAGAAPNTMAAWLYIATNYANIVCLPTSTYNICYPGISFSNFNGGASPVGPGYKFDGNNAMFVGVQDASGRYPTNMFYFPSSSDHEDWFRDVGYCTFSGLVSNSFLCFSGGYRWRCHIHDCQTTANTANGLSVVQALMDSSLSQGGDWEVSRIYGGDSIRYCFHLSGTPGSKSFLDDCSFDHIYCFNQSFAGANYPGAACIYLDQSMQLQDGRIQSCYGSSGAYVVWGDQRGHSRFWRCHFEQIYNEPQTTNAAAIFATTDNCTFDNVNMYQPSQVTAKSFVAVWGTNTHGFFSHCFATYNNGLASTTPWIVETNGSDYNVIADCGTNGLNIVGPYFAPITNHDVILGNNTFSAPSYTWTDSPYTNTTLSHGRQSGAAHFSPASSNGVTGEFDAATNKGSLILRFKDTNGNWVSSIGGAGSVNVGTTNDAGPGDVVGTNIGGFNYLVGSNSVTTKVLVRSLNFGGLLSTVSFIPITLTETNWINPSNVIVKWVTDFTTVDTAEHRLTNQYPFPVLAGSNLQAVLKITEGSGISPNGATNWSVNGPQIEVFTNSPSVGQGALVHSSGSFLGNGAPVNGTHWATSRGAGLTGIYFGIQSGTSSTIHYTLQGSIQYTY